MFYFDKLVIVKRYGSVMGEFNRPDYSLNEVGRYKCHYSQKTNNTTQLEPQKVNYTGETLYLEPECDIKVGDICYIYELDEYDEPVLSTEYRAVADKPYKRIDHIEIPLTYGEEV